MLTHTSSIDLLRLTYTQNIKNKSPKYVEKKPLRDFTLIMGCNVHVLAEKDVIVI